MNRLERHSRRLLKMLGLDPARMTKAQIKRGGCSRSSRVSLAATRGPTASLRRSKHGANWSTKFAASGGRDHEKAVRRQTSAAGRA
jgi:hypothetical protein